MRDLFVFLPAAIFFFVVVSIVRAAAKAAKRNEQTAAAVPQTASNYDPAQAERTRRIQEEIRRKIAERRGLNATTEVPPVSSRMEPPVIYVEEPDAAESETSSSQDAATTTQATTNAVLVRQQKLADQMRALEVSRNTEQRRAAQVATDVKTESVSRTALLMQERAILLEDLRDPLSTRRAFVLREVLGTPVGLR